MKKKKAYVVQRMLCSININTYPEPTAIPFSTFADGCVGMCPVFKTKKEARKIYGKNVGLREIEYKVD